MCCIFRHPMVILGLVLVLAVHVAMAYSEPTTGTPGPAQEAIVGDWAGALQVGAASLRIVFHISADEAGALSATMDSPDQGAFGIAVDETTFEEQKLDMKIAAVAGGYAATLDEEGMLQGTWSQGGRTFPLNLSRQQE